MPLKSDEYKSPIEGDTAFSKMETIADRHYVSLYGVTVRRLLTEIYPPSHCFSKAQLQKQIARRGGLVGRGGKLLGDSSLRHLIKPILTWLVLRGEVEILPSGDYARTRRGGDAA